MRAAALLLSLLLTASAALHAQELDETAPAALHSAEAERLLAEPLPAALPARLALLAQQHAAADVLGRRAQQVELAWQWVSQGRSQPGWAEWARRYVGLEFTWGRAGLALERCEAWVNDRTLPLGVRASLALRQTYISAKEGDLLVTLAHDRRAQRLLRELGDAPGPEHQASPFLGVEALQVRSDLAGLQGQPEVPPLREALRLAAQVRTQDEADRATWLDGTRGMLVYALVREGRPAEALQIAEEQLRRWRRGEHAPSRGARWLYRQATALNALQRHAEALQAAEASLALLDTAQAAATSLTGHLARTEQVRAALGLRDWARADTAYQAHVAAVAGDRVTAARVRNPTLAAVLAATNGRGDEALEAIERSHRYRSRLYGLDHPLTQEAAGVRGFVHLMRGDARQALADFEPLFVALLDRPSGWLDLEQRGHRSFVLGLVIDSYLRWVLAQASPHDQVLNRALQLADRLKLGSTQRALVDASGRLQAGDPALSAGLEAEQQARRESEAQSAALNALLVEEDALRRQMGAAAFAQQPPAAQRGVREQLQAVREAQKPQQAKAQGAREALAAQRAQIAQRFPRYAELVSPSLPSATALSASLQEGEALLVVHALEDGSLAWLLRPRQPPLLRPLPLGEAGLATVAQAWRQQLDLSTRLDEKVDLHAVATSGHALYRQLLAPFDADLSGVRSLLVASSGPLAALPLGALVRSAPRPGQRPHWLIDDMAVSQLPAAASLASLRRQAREAAAPAQALLGYGDPQFQATAAPPAKGRGARLLAPPPTRQALRWDEQRGLRYGDIPPLPDTRDELLAIARALGSDPAQSLRLGAQATRRALLAEPVPAVRVLAFATHGLLPGELPGLSRPALALAADGEAPPLLELDDVLALRLRADWVLLSACNSAGAQQDDTAMSGLVRGFFHAGARSVLATHWAVESRSAAALSSATFAQEASLPRAEALRRAQRQLADGTLGQGAWRHPYFWAGYALFGDPAR